MLTTIILIGTSLLVGNVLPKFKRKPKVNPVNIINGILLPHPADERWIATTESPGCTGHACGDRRNHTFFTLEKIRVFSKCHSFCATIKIDGLVLGPDCNIPEYLRDKAQAYYDAIRYAKQELVALTLV